MINNLLLIFGYEMEDICEFIVDMVNVDTDKTISSTIKKGNIINEPIYADEIIEYLSNILFDNFNAESIKEIHKETINDNPIISFEYMGRKCIIKERFGSVFDYWNITMMPL